MPACLYLEAATGTRLSQIHPHPGNQQQIRPNLAPPLFPPRAEQGVYLLGLLFGWL